MKRVRRLRLPACAMACALLLTALAPTSSFAQPAHESGESHEAREADPVPTYDEFGRLPDETKDKDLSLPDPVLDRTWPAPKAGPSAKPDKPDKIAPDEDKTDPFEDEDAPPPPPRRETIEAPKAPAVPPVVPKRAEPAPLVAPDGRRDAGSPSPEPETVLPDAVEPDIDEPDDEDVEPSPLDEDDRQFDRETKDPAEW